ncbi:MAG: ABC transporter permease [Bacteroidota bacterium]
MVLAVLYREFRIRAGSLTWTFFDLVVPLSYLLLFGIGLDRAFAQGLQVAGRTVPYDAFFLGGVLSMAGLGIAINTAYGFFVDRENGLFYEFLTYPMTRAQFLVGKILFNALLALVQALLTLAAGFFVMGITFRADLLPGALPAVMLGTAGWFFFLGSFALRIRRNDMFNTFINVIYFVLMFASSMFYPLESMPRWLRVISLGNPLTWHTDVLRFLTVGVGEPTRVLAEGAAFGVFLLGSFLLALHTLRRGPQ